MSWELTYTILGTIAAAGGILAAVWKMRKPAARFGASCRAIVNLPNDLKVVSEIVKKELTPNEGGSMRDIVSRLATRFDVGDARSRALLTQMRVALWESDAEGRCTYVSRELCQITGRAPEECLGRGWVSTIHPADRESVLEEWNACVRDGRDFEMRYSFVSRTGDRIEVAASATVCRDGKGTPLGFVGSVVRDQEDA